MCARNSAMRFILLSKVPYLVICLFQQWKFDLKIFILLYVIQFMKIQSWKTPDSSLNYWPTIYTRLQSSAHELSTDCKTSWNTKQKWWCCSWVFLANSKARTYAQEPLWQLVRGDLVSFPPPGADDHNLEPFCSFMKNVSNILPDTFSFSFEWGHFARLKGY